jgi:hypothetical protein
VKYIINQLCTAYKLNFTLQEIEMIMTMCDKNLMKLRNFFRAQYNLKESQQKLITSKNNLNKISYSQDSSKLSPFQKQNLLQNNNITNNFPLTSQNNNNNFTQAESNFSNLIAYRASKLSVPYNNKENNLNTKKHPVVPSKTKIINTEGEKIQFQFFHTLGKILFNKRVDPKDGKIRPMKKHEMERIPMPKSYFNIQEIISEMKYEPAKFNEFLVENSFKHFKDIKELAKVCDTFSYTDTLHRHTFNSKITYENRATTMSNYQSLLNSMACMCVNKSQYKNDSDYKNEG